MIALSQTSNKSPFKWIDFLSLSVIGIFIFGCSGKFSVDQDEAKPTEVKTVQPPANEPEVVAEETSSDTPPTVEPPEPGSPFHAELQLTGLPEIATNASTIAIDVAGAYTAYRYKFGLRSSTDCSAEDDYSAAIDIATPVDLDLSSLSDDEYVFCIQVQAEGNLTLAPTWSHPIEKSFRRDTVAPDVSILDTFQTNAEFFAPGNSSDATPLTFTWEQISGPGILSFSKDLRNPKIEASTPGEYQIKISVTDAAGNVTEKIITLKWVEHKLGISLQREYQEDPNPVLKLFNPWLDSATQIYTDPTCSGTPFVEVPTTFPYTEVPLNLPGFGNYTFYASHQGVDGCLSRGMEHVYQRSVSPYRSISKVITSEHAMAVLYNNGMVLTHGNANYGGDSSAVAAQLTSDVVDVVTSDGTFAALKADGSVVSWGAYPFAPGSVDGSIASLKPAFLGIGALTTTGGLVVSGQYNSDTSSVAGQISSGVVDFVNHRGAGYAIKSDGSVVFWYDPASPYASVAPDQFWGLNCDYDMNWGEAVDDLSCFGPGGVAKARANHEAVVFISPTGKLFATGYSTFGGRLEDASFGYGFDCNMNGTIAEGSDLACLNSGFTELGGNFYTMFAFKGTAVYPWGYWRWGGRAQRTSDGVDCNYNGVKAEAADVACLNNVQKAVMFSAGIAYLGTNGAAFSSGQQANGGSPTSPTYGVDCDGDGILGEAGDDIPCISSGVSDIFADDRGGIVVALKTDGSVVCWGSSTGCGMTDMAPVLNGGVTKVSVATNNFIALKDGKVYSSINSIPLHLKSKLSSNVVDIGAFDGSSNFYAIKADGEFFTWGNLGEIRSQTGMIGNNFVDLVGGGQGFAARRADGSAETWGDVKYSSSVDFGSTLNSGITEIFGTGGALHALTSSGKLHSWGWSLFGGDPSDATYGLDCDQDGNVGEATDDLACLDSGIVKVFGTKFRNNNYDAVAALKTDGSLLTWGYSSAGGDSLSVAGQLSSGVTDVVGTLAAFAALKTDGSAIVWGDISFAGDRTTADCDLNGTTGDDTCLDSNVTQIFAAQRAFVALMNDKTLMSWGDISSGGSLTQAVHGMDCNNDGTAGDLACNSDIETVVPGTYGFVALTSAGRAIPWGGSTYGGSITSTTYGPDCDYDGNKGEPEDVACLASGVKEVVSTNNGFIALKEDGAVIPWGRAEGGASPADATYGIDCNNNGTKGEPIDLACLTSGVAEVYGSDTSPIAIRDDGSLLVWGQSGGGLECDGNGIANEAADWECLKKDPIKEVYTDGNVFFFLLKSGDIASYHYNDEDKSFHLAKKKMGGGAIKIAVTTRGQYAALLTDGSVISWGDPTMNLEGTLQGVE